MIPIETKTTRAWPGTYRRRVTEVKAWQVTHANLQQVAEWTAGHTWAAAVILPGERVANVGDWIVHHSGTFNIVGHDRFTRDFYEVTA